MWMEDCPRDARDAGENVTSAGSVFSSLERLSSNRPSVTRTIQDDHQKPAYRVSGTKLTAGLEEIDIVATNIVLRQSDDGHRQADFSMVVSRFFRNVSGQLRNLEWAESSGKKSSYRRSLEHTLISLTRFFLKAAKITFR
jgi:hypothetical protein